MYPGCTLSAITNRNQCTAQSLFFSSGYSLAGATTNANARWLPNARSTLSLNSKSDSGVGYTTDEYASITYHQPPPSFMASNKIPQQASTLARPQQRQLPMIPDHRATTHPRSAATLPRSLNNCTEPLSRQNAASSNHVNQWSNDPRPRSNQGMQVPRPANTVAMRLFYSFPEDKKAMPYLVGLDLPRGYHPTLEDIKKQCPRKGQQFRYFFKTRIHGMEMLEEKSSNAAVVPLLNGCNIFIECRGPSG